jgi:uncharacterized protein YjdB
LLVAGCASVPMSPSDPPNPPGNPPPQTAESITLDISPASLSLEPAQSHSFTATVNNDIKNQGVIWQLSGSGCMGAACGTISSNSSSSGSAITYTAPASAPSPSAVLLTATAVSDTTKSASAAIAVTPGLGPMSISIMPLTASVRVKKSQNFTATVQNDPQNKGVTWSLSGSGCKSKECGKLSAMSSASGSPVTYTAPKDIPNPATVTLKATSVSDTKLIATATITITKEPAPITVAVSPSSQTVAAKKSQTFTATVQNDSRNQGVTWQLTGAGCTANSCGTISKTSSASGESITYTAPSSVPNPATVTLRATSVTNTSVSAAATITVTAPAPAIVVKVSPSAQSLSVGTSHSFIATVQNDPQNKGVTWELSGTGCTGAACGTLSSASGASINYTAPSAVPNPATVSLRATSVTDTSASAIATITITSAGSGISVSVAPKAQPVPVRQTQSFTATVQNDSQNKGVTWKLSGAGCSGSACGTLSSTFSASGAPITYTAPGTVPSPATVTLTATSVTAPAATSSAAITIFKNSGNAGVTLSPKQGGLTVGQTLQFTASVQNDPGNQGVTWSSSDGSFTNSTSNSAVYQAPGSAGVYTITATSVADVTKSATAIIGVTDLTGVTTYHNDSSRAGVNSKEYALTPANVQSSSFGKLFSCPVDAPVHPQPLWVANLNIAGGVHNVIFAATSHDTVYAFDADAIPCVTYWSKHLIPAGEAPPTATDIGSEDIVPDLGIVGTPVIDLATKILYVVTKTKTQGTNCRTPGSCHQRLHALSLLDGTETAGGPAELTSSITVAGTGGGSSGGRVPFDPYHENQRAALALANNTVYVSWGSHTDIQPWHGWIMGFNKSNLRAAPMLFNATPNGMGAGIWMAGGAPSIDASNNLYAITGNGDYDGKTEFGDSFLKLTSSLSLLDWFTPSDQAIMDSANHDLGSGGAAVLADLPSGPVRHLLIGGGKSGSGYLGELYLLDRDAMGHLEGAGTPIVQKFPVGHELYATPAFWQNSLYIAGAGGKLLAFTLNPSTSQFNPTPSSSSSTIFPERGATPSVSSSATSQGIVWAIDASQYGPPSRLGTGPAVLHAYDATNVSRELWNSAQAASRDQAGNAVKFTVPTVANGKVYIGTASEITVYGLLPN